MKLWELFARIGLTPRPGDTCLDLGSSPGGWTYVLAQLGANVVSVDKAPLDPSVARFPNVHFVKSSAFALNPDDYRDARGERGTMQDEFLVHTREGQECPRCGTEIRRVVVGGRPYDGGRRVERPAGHPDHPRDPVVGLQLGHQSVTEGAGRTGDRHDESALTHAATSTRSTATSRGGVVHPVSPAHSNGTVV